MMVHSTIGRTEHSQNSKHSSRLSSRARLDLTADRTSWIRHLHQANETLLLLDPLHRLRHQFAACERRHLAELDAYALGVLVATGLAIFRGPLRPHVKVPRSAVAARAARALDRLGGGRCPEKSGSYGGGRSEPLRLEGGWRAAAGWPSAAARATDERVLSGDRIARAHFLELPELDQPCDSCRAAVAIRFECQDLCAGRAQAGMPGGIDGLRCRLCWRLGLVPDSSKAGR
mmetsp:Transcript_26290/g.61360  ORF Transcript_26290/g.61360 Transcript_26290/m.61360 type:complete len:231 (-) Transcript_26290:789-1481(-)